LKRDLPRDVATKLAHLTTNEQDKLYKRASKLRKSGREKAGSLHDIVLRLLAEDDAPLPTYAEPAAIGQVFWVGRKTCKVSVGGEHVEARIDGALPSVGDEVEVSAAGAVGRILPRRTKLARPDPGNPHLERVIVANVDKVVVVVSVKTPPLHPRLIDRYLIAIEAGGAQPVLCVNKLDLLQGAERDEELAKLEPYRQLGVPIVLCSAERGEGLDELRRLLAGSLCAFVGHSGVGKSSLMNALDERLGIETGAVSEGYGRGTHTTTASTLHELEGLRVIDTPGIRSFGLWKMGPLDLALYFPEFEQARCRFRDCTHTVEPQCGVRALSELGVIHPVRYETYLRLLEGA
jgi:ribosome biogenesis GTPase / thiamine phosphate phosphatase